MTPFELGRLLVEKQAEKPLPSQDYQAVLAGEPNFDSPATQRYIDLAKKQYYEPTQPPHIVAQLAQRDLRNNRFDAGQKRWQDYVKAHPVYDNFEEPKHGVGILTGSTLYESELALSRAKARQAQEAQQAQQAQEPATPFRFPEEQQSKALSGLFNKAWNTVKKENDRLQQQALQQNPQAAAAVAKAKQMEEEARAKSSAPPVSNPAVPPPATSPPAPNPTTGTNNYGAYLKNPYVLGGLGLGALGLGGYGLYRYLNSGKKKKKLQEKEAAMTPFELGRLTAQKQAGLPIVYTLREIASRLMGRGGVAYEAKMKKKKEREEASKSEKTVKEARNLNLGAVPQGAGPANMYNALSMLNQARTLVNPEKTLEQHGLNREHFNSMIDRLAEEQGDSYDFDALRQNPKNQAILKGLGGAALGGLAGSLVGGVGGGLGGAALGGLGGAGIGYMGAGSHNDKLLRTAKVLREYGLLKPDYLRSALPLLKESGQRGLWDNIHAKRERGEKPAKPGDKDYPDQKSWNATVKASGDAWQRAEGKNPEGGLNAKGRASLKAEGQDIKPPVTEDKPTGERADRKASFCARMGGMKKKLTSSETANDPDSRINKALRKWNC